MHSEDKISIILPVRNGRDFILKAIESFLSQDIVGADKEMVIVDDNSIDDTYSLVLEYTKDKSEILLIKNTGVGIIDALVFGLSQAKGNYISRMDADDIMPKNKLQLLYDVIQDDDVQVATGKVKYFHYDKDRVGDGYLRYENWLNELVDQQEYYTDIYKECVVASPNWLIGRKHLEEVGGFKGLYPEDYDLVFRWYSAGYKIKGVNFVTHYWYDHEARASRNDENYRENNFFDLKLNWFFKLDYREERGVLIYGAGNKGKYLVRKIQEMGYHVTWCSNNPKKIGKNIYGITLISDQENIEKMNKQVIIAIAVEEDKRMIKQRFVSGGLKLNIDFFNFA
ncbi:MAG: glycosyltransferase involved in cell wall biosynthesis [Patiriisocius sp.]